MKNRKSILVMAVLMAILIVTAIFQVRTDSLEKRITVEEQANDEMFINTEKLLEKFTSNTEVTLDSIFQKLSDYSSQLGDGIYYGVISLSNQEMEILREFAKDNMLDFSAEECRTYTIPTAEKEGNILKRDSLILGLGYCVYGEGILYVHFNRQFVYYDLETGKLIAITNPIDLVDDNYGEYNNVLWDYGENCNRDMPYRLYTTTTSCYAYYEKEDGCIIKEMQFGKVVHTWDGSQIVNGDSTSDRPQIVAYGSGGTHFFVASHNLMCFRESEDKINLVSNNVNLEDVILPSPASRTLYYRALNELHMIDLDTLKDTIIAEDAYSGPTVLEYADEKGVYYVIAYCSVDGYVRLVATVFEDYIAK